MGAGSASNGNDGAVAELGLPTAPSLRFAPFKASHRFRFSALREEVAPTSPRGTRWDVRIIQAGPSLNGKNYPAEAVRESAAIFEGARVFSYEFKGSTGPTVDHLPDEVKAQDGNRGLAGNVIGMLEGVHWNEAAQALDGTLVVVDPSTRTKLVEAYDLGMLGDRAKRNIVGLSIDAHGETKPNDPNTLHRFTAATSVDLVTTPAAGGRFITLREALDMAKNDATKLQEAAPPALAGSGQPAQATAPGKTKPEEKPAATPAAPATVQENAGAQPAQPNDPNNPANASDAKVKALADRLSGATDTEKQAIREAIAKECQMSQPTAPVAAAPASTPAVASASAPVPGTPAGIVPGSPVVQEAVKRLAESKEVAALPVALKESLKVLAGGAGVAFQEADRRDAQIMEMREAMKGMAIETEFGKIASGLKLREGVAGDIMKLADMSGVSVGVDGKTVNGLREAVQAVIKDRPWYLQESTTPAVGVQAPAQPATASTPGTPAAPAQESKTTRVRESVPAPRGQAVALRESVQGDAGPARMTDEQFQRSYGQMVAMGGADPGALGRARRFRESRERGEV